MGQGRDFFGFQVTGRSRMSVFGFDFDDDRYSWSSDNSSDGGVELEFVQRERVDAQWRHVKRAVLYQDVEMDGKTVTSQQQCGWLQVDGFGRYTHVKKTKTEGKIHDDGPPQP